MGHVQLLTTCLILQMGLVACNQNTTTYTPSEKDSLSRRIDPAQYQTMLIVSNEQVTPLDEEYEHFNFQQFEASLLSEYLQPTNSIRAQVQQYRQKLGLKADEIIFFGKGDSNEEKPSIDIRQTEFLATANDLAINHLRSLKTQAMISEQGQYETSAEYAQRQAQANAQHQQRSSHAIVDLSRIEDALNLSGYVWVLKQADSDRFHEISYDADQEMIRLRTLITDTSEHGINHTAFEKFPQTLHALEIQAHLPIEQAKKQFDDLKSGTTLAFIMRMDQNKRLSLDRIALLSRNPNPVVIEPKELKFSDILVEVTKTRNEETGHDEYETFYSTHNEQVFKLKQAYPFQFGIKNYRLPHMRPRQSSTPVQPILSDELLSRHVPTSLQRGQSLCV